MMSTQPFLLLILVFVSNHEGCGSNSTDKASTVVPTKSNVDKRSSRTGKLEKSLQEYYIAYGIDDGASDWNERLKVFLNHVQSLNDANSKSQLENVMGRVLQDLTIRLTRRKVGSTSALMFSPLVHIFMAICRAVGYSQLVQSSDSFPHKAEFIQEYDKFITTSIGVLTTELGGLNPGQRFASFTDNVGLMQRLAAAALKKADPSADPKKIDEQALKLGTEIYELDKLKVVPQAILNGVFLNEHFKALSTLLINCSHNDHMLPGLMEQIVDKCYAGLLAYKQGLEKLFNTGDFNDGSAAHLEFDSIAKINKEIRIAAEKIAIAQLELD